MTILERYNEVFSEDGTVKLCGRYACMGLISNCKKLRPGVDFGNTETGFMNAENIHKLMEDLLQLI